MAVVYSSRVLKRWINIIDLQLTNVRAAGAAAPRDARARPLGASLCKTTLVAEIATKSICSSCRDAGPARSPRRLTDARRPRSAPCLRAASSSPISCTSTTHNIISLRFNAMPIVLIHLRSTWFQPILETYFIFYVQSQKYKF